MSTKVLITGASGLLGRAIYAEFNKFQTFHIIGTAYKRPGDELIKLDLLNRGKTRETLSEIKPQVIIHCAAERRPDICRQNPQLTEKLNISVTQQLAEITSSLSAWMIYISSDYVFDGTQPPYKPDSVPCPLNNYGESKLAGERVVMSHAPRSAILRIPLLYGRVQYLAESSVTQLFAYLQAPKKVKIDHWAIRYPTFVDDVAVVCRQMVQYRLKTPKFSGIYHWSGNEAKTKYQMVKEMATVGGYASNYILEEDSPTPGAPRPKNCQLDCGDLIGLGFGQFTPFKTGIRYALAGFLS